MELNTTAAQRLERWARDQQVCLIPSLTRVSCIPSQVGGLPVVCRWWAEGGAAAAEQHHRDVQPEDFRQDPHSQQDGSPHARRPPHRCPHAGLQLGQPGRPLRLWGHSQSLEQVKSLTALVTNVTKPIESWEVVSQDLLRSPPVTGQRCRWFAPWPVNTPSAPSSCLETDRSSWELRY